jgi:hypothetical protein
MKGVVKSFLEARGRYSLIRNTLHAFSRNAWGSRSCNHVLARLLAFHHAVLAWCCGLVFLVRLRKSHTRGGHIREREGKRRKLRR